MQHKGGGLHAISSSTIGSQCKLNILKHDHIPIGIKSSDANTTLFTGNHADLVYGGAVYVDDNTNLSLVHVLKIQKQNVSYNVSANPTIALTAIILQCVAFLLSD